MLEYHDKVTIIGNTISIEGLVVGFKYNNILVFTEDYVCFDAISRTYIPAILEFPENELRKVK